MLTHLSFFQTITKDLSTIETDRRLFEGYLTVQMVDKQNEITIVDELAKVLPVWMARGAPISDTHTNRIIGKGLNYSKTTVTDEDGNTYPAIYIQGEIYKDYELDKEIWEKMKSGEYKGLSFGGATKSNRRPEMQKNGKVAYSLWDLEHYEVAVCEDPAVPLALITQTNSIAKAMTSNWVERGDGTMCIRCTEFGCYIDKDRKKPRPEGREWSNEPEEAFDPADHQNPSADNTFRGTDKYAIPLVGENTNQPKFSPSSRHVGGQDQLKDDDNKKPKLEEVDEKNKLSLPSGKPSASVTGQCCSSWTNDLSHQISGKAVNQAGDYSVQDIQVEDNKKDDKKKDENLGFGGVRGAGAARAHRQDGGDSTQLTQIDKEPPDEKKKDGIPSIQANNGPGGKLEGTDKQPTPKGLEEKDKILPALGAAAGLASRAIGGAARLGAASGGVSDDEEKSTKKKALLLETKLKLMALRI